MNKIVIYIKGSLNRFIKKCIDNNIELSNINYLNEEEAYVLINLQDYKKIKRLNYFCEIKIIKYNGLIGLKLHLKKYLFTYLLFIFCFALMDILSSYIVKIDIIHENKSIRTLVEKELDNHGLKKYTLALNFDELEKIKNEILDDNPDTLEWLSITRTGMTYVVRVEERIIKTDEEEPASRNVVAKKDALITKIISTKGEVIVRSGDYVKKGDILINGNITLYDEVKGYTAATGTVYGNVWYETEVKVPTTKEITTDTGKKRYNLNINNKIFLKNKYQYFRQENIKEIKILGLKIKIYKEVEYTKSTTKLSEEEIDEEAQNKITEAFNQKLKNEGTIISQKVLKKEANNSTIDYKVFVITNEIISEYENLDLEK
jgi:similar to stage IV sporulation protein